MKKKAIKEQSLGKSKKEFKNYNRKGNQNRINKMHKIDSFKLFVDCKIKRK